MTKRILFLTSNPIATERLRIDEEIREITDSWERTKNRSSFEFVQKWAVRYKDFRRALLETQPQIVHFSGHGEGESGIILEDKDGKPQLVSAKVLGDLFSHLKGVECVVLNACYTDDQANEITNHVDYVIGKRDSFSDPAAIAFSVGFYDAIFAGRSYSDAFGLGCNALRHEFPDEVVPTLMENKVESTNQGMEPLDQVKTQTPNTIIDEEDEKDESEKSSPKTYLYRLKKTRTYLFGLIVDTIEYDFNVRLGGLFRTLPQLPQANSEHHVVVIEIRNRKPNVMAVLTEPGVSINPTSRDVGKLIFVVLSVKPHLIEIASPQEGYVLSDGQRVSADIELVFRIINVEPFWHSGEDPIGKLESQVVAQMSRYFSKLNTVSLIKTLLSSAEKPETQMINSKFRIKDWNFQAECDDLLMDGLHIEETVMIVHITIQLQQLLNQVRFGSLFQRDTPNRDNKEFMKELIESHTDLIEKFLLREDTDDKSSHNFCNP